MKVLLIVDDEAYARQAVANTIPWAEHGVEVHQAVSYTHLTLPTILRV